ncbi:unnamed protein product [Brassica oleracea]
MEINAEENPQESSEWFVKYLNRQGDWLEKTRGNLMVAATVIAGMSFQVIVNPPGGVWQSDNCPSGNQTNVVPVCKAKAGTSVLEYSSKRVLYLGMIVSSTVSFSASMSLLLLIISGLRLRIYRNRMIMGILVTFMIAAVLCISAAFFFAMALVQSDDKIIIYVLTIYLGFWIVFPILILIIQLVRFIGWIICFICCCCCRPRRRRSP